MFRAFARLRALLVERPFVTNATLSGAMMLIGDQLAQKSERQAREAENASAALHASSVPAAAPVFARSPDWARTATLCSWAFVASSFWTGYYGVLHRRLPGKYALWVVLTAAVPGPLINAGFFSYSTAVEELRRGGDAATALAAAREKLRTRWLPTVVVSTQLWAVLNYVNFRFVSNEFRVLFGMTANLAWNFVLSQQQALPPGVRAKVPFLWSPDVHWSKESGSWPRIAMEAEAPPSKEGLENPKST